jgi:copper homeostasis protein (lipoprotein)
MLKNLFLPILSGVLLTACGTKATTENAANGVDSTAMTADTLVADNAHTAQNALDWNGMYKGVVPCADCEGIETVLVLNTDNTYLLRTTYLGKGDAAPVERTGTLTWNAAGNTVILAGIENAPNQYFVGENALTQLDMTGNKITGQLAEKYILAKQ